MEGEGNGLTNEEDGECDICVFQFQQTLHPILNISHAAAIIFYELFKNMHEYPVEGLEESTAIEKNMY